MHKPKAVALRSGGLDSSLAVLAVLRQNIDVTAITFLTYFGCDISDHSSCSKNPYPAAEKFGFMVKLSPLGEKFVEIVKNPQYGHGRNMNPCIDCQEIGTPCYSSTFSKVKIRPAADQKEVVALAVCNYHVLGRYPSRLCAKFSSGSIHKCEILSEFSPALSGRSHGA